MQVGAGISLNPFCGIKGIMLYISAPDSFTAFAVSAIKLSFMPGTSTVLTLTRIPDSETLRISSADF